MELTKTKHGTTLTPGEVEYRKILITELVCCPITNEVLSLHDGEILYVNGNDYFISNAGLDILNKIFGEKFISERIITYD